MANTYFQFKQFTINQDQCAMKVCTDSCVFGAMLPTHTTDGTPIKNVLDIGTGTGLLSLLYAQQNAACNITAIEIDHNASNQAQQNIANSTFAEQIEVLHTDYLQYQPNKKFDLIICNPPFYQASLPSADMQKNIALHATHFDIQACIIKVATELSQSGLACFLLPTQHNDTAFLQPSSLHIHKKILLFNRKSDAKPFRQIVTLGKNNNEQIITHFYIKDNENYSDDFVNLMRPFYLKL